LLKASRATGLSRRHLLTLLGGAAAATMAPSLALAAPRDGVRRLTLHNLHTGEKLTAAYWEKGCYDRTELDAVARLCRDFRTGEVHPIDCELLDLVHRLGRTLATSKPIELISAYRSPKTNAVLAAQSSGVAKRSMHMQGKAFDIRLPGVSARDIYKAALNLRGGGVGLYAKSNFVHVDVGRVRNWIG
jgi:uncharacterized protein YcbK (DUF882 family)